MTPLFAKLLSQVAKAGEARSAARAAGASGPPGPGNLAAATFLIVVQIVLHIGR